MRKITSIIIIGILMMGFQSCKKSTDDENIEIGVKVGSLAPDFQVGNETGVLHKLSDYKGQYVVVDFWAAWCGICRNENPKMETLYNTYKNKNLTVLGVCLDANRSNWLKAVEEDQISYIQLIDEAAFESQVAKKYGITSVPLMLLLDTKGKILTITSRVSDITARLEQEIP